MATKNSATLAAPTQTPPDLDVVKSAASTAATPDRLGPNPSSSASSVAEAAERPIQQPPASNASSATSASRATSTAGAGAVATAIWQTAKTISATWSSNDTRNAWALVDGVGWRKIFDGSDGAFMALCLLASQARQSGHQVNFREDSGTIYEIYLW